MADAALFEQVADDRFRATDLSRGPWSPDSLHGGPVGILLAGPAEVLLEDLFPARITIELLRPVPVGQDLVVRAEVVRPGRKVRLVRSEIATADGTLLASAVALGIRIAAVDAPSGGPADEPFPGPDTVAATSFEALSLPGVRYDAFANSGVEHRFVRGSFLEVGPATDWIRLRVPVVAGAEPSPLQRVLAAADFGNGISRLATFEELLFINPDLTVHLHRLPVGEWVSLDARSQLESHGTGLAHSALHDGQGPIGHALQSLLLEARSAPAR